MKANSIRHSPTDTLMHYCYNYSEMTWENLSMSSPHPTLPVFRAGTWSCTLLPGFRLEGATPCRGTAGLWKEQAGLAGGNACHPLPAEAWPWTGNKSSDAVPKQGYFQAPSSPDVQMPSVN